MRLRQLSLLVFLMLCALGTAHAVYWYPRLPERMATHFDFNGKPDGWSTKGTFITIYYGVTAVSALLLFGVALLFRFLPARMMNLPNKEFWCSPEHQQETHDFLFYYFFWFASATLLLLIDLAEQTFRVNLGKTAALPHSMLSLGCYLAFTALWAAGLIATFIRKPKTSDN
jgi:Protein of unknown function (DUF1648)